MALALESFVLETLTSHNIDHLNFRFGPMRVYPSGYRDDIAGSIRNGSIQLTNDPSAVSSSTADGVFVADTPRGQIHPFFINPRLTVARDGRIYLRDGVSSLEKAHLRGTIIHEATHALQDWQRNELDPPTAEGAAYLAGAIARRLWGYRTPAPITNPRAGVHAYAFTLADRFLATPPSARYIIPMNDVQALRSLAPTGSAHRYVFDGI